MQDSRLGTYGAVALFFVLFAKFQLLTALHADWMIVGLICAHALSRLCAVWLISNLSYVKPAGKAKPLSTQISNSDLVWANVFGLLPTAMLVWAIYSAMQGYWQICLLFIALLVLLISLTWLWWRRLLLRKLGGYTGDNLGAMQQLTELAFYLAALIFQQLIAKHFFGLL